LLSGLAKPLHTFGVVLRDSLAEVVYSAEVVLGVGLSLLSGFAIPLRSFGVVLRNSLAAVVCIGKRVLSFLVSLLGKPTSFR
jgi:hypothetical protein